MRATPSMRARRWRRRAKPVDLHVHLREGGLVTVECPDLPTATEAARLYAERAVVADGADLHAEYLVVELGPARRDVLADGFVLFGCDLAQARLHVEALRNEQVAAAVSDPDRARALTSELNRCERKLLRASHPSLPVFDGSAR